MRIQDTKMEKVESCRGRGQTRGERERIHGERYPGKGKWGVRHHNSLCKVRSTVLWSVGEEVSFAPSRNITNTGMVTYGIRTVCTVCRVSYRQKDRLDSLWY